MTYLQRITITTIDQEAADTIYSYMVNNSFTTTNRLPSFTNHADEKYTICGDIPITSDNGALVNVHNIIIRYFHTLLSYTSEPA